MDKYILKNNGLLWQKIINSPVQLIICGHVHGHYSLQYQQVNIEAAPATCFQIKTGACDLVIENSVGYKVHFFTPTKYQSIPVMLNIA